jgi:hypothetical protein
MLYLATLSIKKLRFKDTINNVAKTTQLQEKELGFLIKYFLFPCQNISSNINIYSIYKCI